ncbi:MAG TPA: hypothetical protein EYP29_03480 [Thermoplasmata archaeon]|nr:hypothetical protein [Thermoplasmata archaeon]
MILAISILTIAEITSTGVYFEENDPYQDRNLDVVLGEVQGAFFQTLSAKFNSYNFSGVTDVKAVIYELFNSTKEIYYRVMAENGEHLYIKLLNLTISSQDSYRVEMYFSLSEGREKVSNTATIFLKK